MARNAWAPDISYFNGKYHLYYSVSSFGSRNSAIGLATTRTLDPSSPDYRWTDEGMVLRSYQDKDDWNAIDPNLVLDGDRAWLVWGSFWGGIKMRRVDPSSGKLSAADETMHSLSSRPREQPINGSVEAPFIVRHGDYWYLFVSFDRCCRGAQSTYNVVVGRSRSVTGPYVDRSGKPMTEGGGTLVIEATTPTWRGPGHPAVFSEGGKDYHVLSRLLRRRPRPRLGAADLDAGLGGWLAEGGGAAVRGSPPPEARRRPSSPNHPSPTRHELGLQEAPVSRRASASALDFTCRTRSPVQSPSASFVPRLFFRQPSVGCPFTSGGHRVPRAAACATPRLAPRNLRGGRRGGAVVPPGRLGAHRTHPACARAGGRRSRDPVDGTPASEYEKARGGIVMTILTR